MGGGRERVGGMGLVREGNNVVVMLACLLASLVPAASDVMEREGRDDAKQCNNASILDKGVMRSR